MLMDKLEKEIERKLREAIKKRGGLCMKWVCPGWSGVPDRIILLPGGLVIFCELKRPDGGRLGKMQAWWRSRLRELGFQAYVVANEGELATLMLIIDGYLGRR